MTLGFVEKLKNLLAPWTKPAELASGSTSSSPTLMTFYQYRAQSGVPT
jgi:hypothetical protein